MPAAKETREHVEGICMGLLSTLMGFQAFLSVTVIYLFFLWVREYLICMGDLYEFLLSTCIFVLVRVVFSTQPFVRFPDVLLRSRLGDLY